MKFKRLCKGYKQPKKKTDNIHLFVQVASLRFTSSAIFPIAHNTGSTSQHTGKMKSNIKLLPINPCRWQFAELLYVLDIHCTFTILHLSTTNQKGSELQMQLQDNVYTQNGALYIEIKYEILHPPSSSLLSFLQTRLPQDYSTAE